MASIPWWVWLVVGVFVAITSVTMGKNLILFAWIGLLFILVGIGKAVYYFLMREKPEHQMSVHSYEQHLPRTQHQLHCPRCKTIVQANDYFCRLCGLRLR